jgi:hypothetical protein
VPSQVPIIVHFQSALSISRSVLEDFTAGFKGKLKGKTSAITVLVFIKSFAICSFVASLFPL